MEAAETVSGGPARVLAAEREVTRLGESVFRTGEFSEDAIAAACATLGRMAAQYKALDVAGVRAVATSSARDARNQAEFVERTSEAAGAPVEVISGREEARLVHLGVVTRWPQPGKRVLIVDIGGGSVELIGDEDGRTLDAVSRPLGAVRLWEIFLPEDPPAARDLHRMREFIEDKLGDAPRRFRGPWDRVIATSATASAIVCAIHGVPRSKRDRADRLRVSTAQVRSLYRKLKGLDLARRRRITGIGPRRAEIIVPGAAVLLEMLERLGAPGLNYSAAGVRDGVIADLAARGVGRELSELSADQRTEVERMALRYSVSLKHARKVAALARTLFRSLDAMHRLPHSCGRLLDAAAYLHDVGHFISDSSHHKHSYYVVANSDMAGFTARERELVANLCRYHRKALPSPEHANLRQLSSDERRALIWLIPLLRVADGLDRSHEQRVRSIECAVRDGHVEIRLNASGEFDLEDWAAERAGEVFQQVYGAPLVVQPGSGA